ncbi:hypothetical protein D3C78_1372510 [compost metagenome]
MADFRGEFAFRLAVFRQAEVADIAIHHLLHAAVWHVVGASLVETHRHLGIGHQRCAFGDVDHPLVNILRLIELRRADQVQHLGIDLHHIG